MGARSQVLAGPVAVACAGDAHQLATFVAADVLVRHARSSRPAALATAVVGGGLCHHYAAEEALRREGLDKAAAGRPAFVARVAEVGRDVCDRLASAAAALGLGLDAAEAGRAGEEAARAARVAFVRLFEVGMVVEAERVVDVCPRCATVAGGPDAVPGVVDGEALVLRLSVLDGGDAVGWLHVRCVAPELVPGAVAVAVPEGHPAAGRTAAVPVAGTVVPVVADPTVAEPALVVPAHDPAGLERARRAGLEPVAVVDATGTVRAPGPLEGLARHAARAAAHRLLGAEGVVTAVEPAAEPVARCAACRTVLVPLLGRHWFLAVGDLLTAAADAVREGALLVSPATARDELLAVAGAAGDWCLSRQLWAGQPLPVARCADCDSVDVSVEAATSCRRCMGDLVPEDGVLDAGFVACMWPLSRAGWPDGRRSAEAADATLVARADRLAEVLAMAGLGMRLAGASPFGEVVVAGAGVASADGPADVDVGALVASEGRAGARLALLCGGSDPDAGRHLAARLDAVPHADGDVDALEGAVRATLDAGLPAHALGVLAAGLAAGLPPAARDRARALAAPFVAG